MFCLALMPCRLKVYFAGAVALMKILLSAYFSASLLVQSQSHCMSSSDVFLKWRLAGGREDWQIHHVSKNYWKTVIFRSVSLVAVSLE